MALTIVNAVCPQCGVQRLAALSKHSNPTTEEVKEEAIRVWGWHEVSTPDGQIQTVCIECVDSSQAELAK